VTVAQVEALAASEGITPADACARLVFDALMAAGARARGYESSVAVEVGRRAVLARALLEREKAQLRAKPVTDEEVAKLTAMRWVDLDRPVARRTVHAVARNKDDTEASWRAADEVAKRIADAVRGETKPEAFMRKAREAAKKNDGVKVVVEELAPVTEDGRAGEPGSVTPTGTEPGRYAQQFVEAVFAIPGVGQQSAPVRSAFGTHVILLVEILPEQRLPLERRRAMLTDEIVSSRVRESIGALTEQLRNSVGVDVARNAGTVLEIVTIPEPTGD
jgi:peptidyl-prolyl cis-trans isomerase C